MKRKRLLCHIIVCVVVVVGYMCLTDIVTSFFSDEVQVKEVNFDELAYNSELYFYLNEMENVGDIQEKIELSGWAFCETDGDYSNKQLYIVFKGKRKSYISRACPMRIDDIHRMGWKNVPGGENNFQTIISTAKMVNDDYRIYLYLVENEYTVGLADSGQEFSKKGIEIQKGENYVCHRSITEDFCVDGLIDQGYISLNVEGNILNASGWCFPSGVDVEKSKYYLAFFIDNELASCYEIANTYRLDVFELFQDEGCTKSGFRAGIPIGELPKDYDSVAIIIENDGKRYISSLFQVEGIGEAVVAYSF